MISSSFYQLISSTISYLVPRWETREVLVEIAAKALSQGQNADAISDAMSEVMPQAMSDVVAQAVSEVVDEKDEAHKANETDETDETDEALDINAPSALQQAVERHFETRLEQFLVWDWETETVYRSEPNYAAFEQLDRDKLEDQETRDDQQDFLAYQQRKSIPKNL